MSTLEEPLELFLTDAESHRPVLEDGIDSDAATQVPKPTKDDASHGLSRPDADPNDLKLQRCSVLAPEGREGDRLLEAIRLLIELRREEQGGIAPTVYRVPWGMNRKAIEAWIDQVYYDENVDEDDRPRYVCILGSPDQMTFELQHSLGHCAFVGRIHFDKPDGETDVDAYAAYANKVVNFARGARITEPPDLLYYVAPDGSRATSNATSRVIVPSMETTERVISKGNLEASSVRQIEANSVDALLSASVSGRPSVMLSVSHGLGSPRNGFKSFEEQARLQGALVVGQKEVLDAERILGKSFLPGGLWFFFACFGAGTPSPASSEFHLWLDMLSKSGAYRDSASAVLSSLATSGNGFIAALPQAALRNQNGPLAVIGHVDLAWSYAYTNHKIPSKSRSSRFTKVLHAMARGSRVGAAFDQLMEGFREANYELTGIYQLAAAERMKARPDPTEPKYLAQVWMLRNDLRGYVVLGDPAVRLSQAEVTPSNVENEPVLSVPKVQSSTSARESAVMALLQGKEAPREIAKRAGCSIEQLFAWFETHRAVEREKQVR